MHCTIFFFFFILFYTLSLSSSSSLRHINTHRRLLHQPFIPINSNLPPPPSKPKYPFSSTPPSPHFFPLYPSPSPPPPSSPPTTFPTFPANVSSLVLSQNSSKPISRKLVAIAVSLSLLSATLIALFLLYHRRQHLNHRNSKQSDTLRLVPPNFTPSDARNKNLLRNGTNTSSTSSSEFLYLGTLNHNDLRSASSSLTAAPPPVSTSHRKIGSPELHPLPPLPRHNFFRPAYYDDDDDDEFFSPRGSSGRIFEPEPEPENPNSNLLTTWYQDPNSPEVFENKNFNSQTTSYLRSNPASPINPSPKSFGSKSSNPPVLNSPSPVSPPEINTESPTEHFPVKVPPPQPPPLPPARFWETRLPLNSVENPSEIFEISKPKLKPFHWDKVQASSDRATVWDHLKSSSFQLNEEMIETLFMVNSTNLNSGKNQNPHFLMPLMNQDNNFLLDPRKSQNISILLRAVNLTFDETCEALLEGNTDSLGAEVLENLLKMAPTKEEERKLKEFKDEEVSQFKLGPAEKFLKALLEIPFVFKRIESMLYIANFDTEVEYLHTSFQTLEAACEELRNNRMFMKLLEAVLRTGNRMNIGTNRGDAHAFKLDTLLKLVDIKGTDGKTTLLHFVVEEIVRSEGSRFSDSTNQNTPTGENPIAIQEEKKLGLQVVSGLIGELENVKKVAAMDYYELSSEVPKLARGMGKIREVLKLDEELPLKENNRKFSESMKGFLKKAEEEIMKIQVQASVALTKVKEITEYFHGNSSKEEAHPFRIFMVVRDFLSVLDRVCKEVGRINERNVQASSSKQFPPPDFAMFNVMGRHNS